MKSRFDRLYKTIMESTKPSKKITLKKVIKEDQNDFDKQVEQWRKNCDENKVKLNKLFEDNKDNTKALKNCYFEILTQGEEDIDWDTDFNWIKKENYEKWGFNNVPDFIDVSDEPQFDDPTWEFNDGWACYVLNILTKMVGEDTLNNWRGEFIDEL